MKFMAPIPGMSLTKEPGNAPYEQPPLYDTPEEALAFYFEKMDDEDTVDDFLFAFENGYPIESLVDSLTSLGAMEGYHSIDVKMLISPIIHEYLVNLAEAADIDYTEMQGPSREEELSDREQKRTKIMLQKALEEDDGVSPESMAKAEEALSDTPEEDTAESMDMPPSEGPLIQRRV